MQLRSKWLHRDETFDKNNIFNGSSIMIKQLIIRKEDNYSLDGLKIPLQAGK
jgi:hypothetical protein